MIPTILAIDIGFGNTKLVFGRDGEHWSELCFKSVAPRVRSDAAGPMGGLSEAHDRVTIQVGKFGYLVGPDTASVGSEPNLGNDYIETAEYLALLRGAICYSMKRSGQFVPRVDVLVLGLPVSNWQNRQTELMKIAEGPHPIPVPIERRAEFGETLLVNVGKVIVLPQPMGALQHALKGMSVRELRADDTIHMVIDPGYKTFDWFVSKGVRPELQRSGSLQGGVSQLIKHVASAAGAKLGSGTVNFAEVEAALASGMLSVQGQRMPMAQFADVMDAEAELVVRRFVNAIDMNLGIGSIHLVGGGANYYANALRKVFRGYDISIAAGSVMANARGFYLVGEAVASML